MFPWLWLWSPRFELPLSGDVVQDIEPTLQTFFNGIGPKAGNARIERRAFGVASYGKQLGLLTELLIDLAERSAPQADDAKKALTELQRIRREIEALKKTEYAQQDAALAEQVQAVLDKGGARAQRLRAQLKAPRAA